MPEITVYPPYRAAVGQGTLHLELPPGTTLRSMLEVLGERYPEFREFAQARSDEFLWGQLIVHVNDDIAGLETPIQPDDRIDLLPPIAGGSR
jgi:molybdopterin converting factor small subunit